jgi:hypothetical protein
MNTHEHAQPNPSTPCLTEGYQHGSWDLLLCEARREDVRTLADALRLIDQVQALRRHAHVPQATR